MKRLVESAFSTCDEQSKIELVFYLDFDDAASKEMAVELMSIYGVANVKAITGPKIKLSHMWNHCAQFATSEILMVCGDDIVFNTQNWDNLVCDAFEKVEDKIMFLHGDDGLNANRFGTHGFLHRNWVNTVGYLLPPYFSADWCDTWINDVANMLNRRVYIPIVTEHLHFVLNKSAIDATHQERLDRDRLDNNKQIYIDKRLERDLDFLKLKAFMLQHAMERVLSIKL